MLLRDFPVKILLYICEYLNIIELARLYRTSRYFQYIVDEALHELILIKSGLQIALHCDVRKTNFKSNCSKRNMNSCTIHFRHFRSKMLHFFKTGTIWKYVCSNNTNPIIELNHGNYHAFHRLTSVQLNNCSTDFYNLALLRRLTLTNLILINVKTRIDFGPIIVSILVGNPTLRLLVIKKSHCDVTEELFRTVYKHCPNLAKFVTDTAYSQYDMGFLLDWIKIQFEMQPSYRRTFIFQLYNWRFITDVGLGKYAIPKLRSMTVKIEYHWNYKVVMEDFTFKEIVKKQEMKFTSYNTFWDRPRLQGLQVNYQSNEAAYWNELAWQHLTSDCYHGTYYELGGYHDRKYQQFPQKKCIVKTTVWNLESEPYPMC